jgi:hypothetical protein
MQFQKMLAVAATVFILFTGFAAAGFTPQDAGSQETAGDATVDAATGIDGQVKQLVSYLPTLSAFNDASTDTSSVKPGEVITFTVSDELDFACKDTVFVLEAYAPEPPSDRDYEVRSLDHLSEYDPITVGSVVTADIKLVIPEDAETGTWTAITYTYCYQTPAYSTHSPNQIIGGSSDVGSAEITVVEKSMQDSDGDGFIDSEDPCPQKAGGLDPCPDSDGDGIVDPEDSCPNTAASTLDGCPEPTDGGGSGGNGGSGKFPAGAAGLGAGVLIVLAGVVWLVA